MIEYLAARLDPVPETTNKPSRIPGAEACRGEVGEGSALLLIGVSH